MSKELKPVRCGCGGEAQVDCLLQPDGFYMAGCYCKKCGKTTIADGGTISVELTPEQIANAPKNDPVGEKGVPGCNDGMCKIETKS